MSDITFEEWIDVQDDEIRTLYRQAASRQAQEADDLRSQMSSLQGELESAQESNVAYERRARFYDEGASQGVRNLRLAYLAAAESSLMDDKGVDWAELRSRFPELFTPKSSPGRPGAGRGAPGPCRDGDMNSWIRKAAGR